MRRRVEGSGGYVVLEIDVVDMVVRELSLSPLDGDHAQLS